jgi:hypothetical protein
MLANLFDLAEDRIAIRSLRKRLGIAAALNHVSPHDALGLLATFDASLPLWPADEPRGRFK